MKKWLTYMVLLLCMGHVWGQTYHVGDLYTAPDGSQGIVYYLNPDGSGGWVVALSDASTGCYWDWENPSDIPGLQNYTSDYLQVLLNDTSGYQNTQTIRNFLNDPYSAAGIVDFDNGWVLPSPAQLRMLYAQLPFVSAALEAAGGADLADASYWTSAEKDGNFAWSVVFSTGFSGYFYANVKGSTFCRVRAVRSFTYEPTYVWSTGDTASSITVSPEQTTAYAVTATTLIGCSDSADQTVTVLHYDTTHLYEAACDSYLWYGDSLVQSGEYSHTLTATTGCDSVVTLHLTVSHSDTTFLTETVCSQYVWYNDTLTQSGEYTYTLTNAIGCDSVLRLQLTVIPLPVLSHTLDTVIINGTSATLWASGADYLYWTDGNDSILSSGNSLTVSPGTTTVYYISGQNGDPTAGDNLVVNGDFEAGNTGFTSAYNYNTNLFPAGNYYVGPNAHNYHSGFYSWSDHTTASGLYMIVNGATIPNTNVWTQTVTVTPNTDYAFSTWVCSVGGTPSNPTEQAQLQFSVNGVQLGNIFTAPNAYGVWSRYYEVWNSGNNTSATLTILNQNTAGGGNDFGLDDITFTPLTNCFVTDSILVEVSGYPDNVDSADCTFLPEGTEWGIGQPLISSASAITVSTPMVGDIDGDGQQEIVFPAGNSSVSSTINIFNADATLKSQFNTVGFYIWNSIGLARVKWQENEYKSIIVMLGTNKRLYAYDAQGTQLWQSNAIFGTQNNESTPLPSISFADFNHDGWTEIYIGAEIYDAATGVLLCKASENKGYSGRTWDTQANVYHTIAADLCGDYTLELAIGNTVYAVDIQSRTDFSANQMTVVREVPSSAMMMEDNSPIPFTDGNTYLADMNLDGRLDVLVMNVDQSNRVLYLYVWDVESQSIICSKKISNARKFGTPQIGDINQDGYDEICFITGTYSAHSTGNNDLIYALKYNPQSTNGGLDVLWTKSHSDNSACTGLTLFDFNQDGIAELVYRDRFNLRIINGSLIHHQTGAALTQPYDMAVSPCHSATGLEYPLVVDVDLDGEAEIVVGGSTIETDYGHLYIFKSDGVPWAPARKVWNQFMYHVTNVNEDLTIPQYMFNNATAFTDPEGVVRRPFNNFLQQATTIDQYGRPFYPVPDVVVNGADIQDDEDSVLVTISYCNSGDNTLNAPYTISIFANAYGGDTVCTIMVDESLPVDSCTQSDIQVPISSLCGFQTLDSLVIAVNCAGTGIAQNGGQQPECDTTNNTAAIAVTLPTDSTHLFETACDSYLWYGDSLVQSGEYPHTLTATTGCDSVVIMHLTVNHSDTTFLTETACSQYVWFNDTLTQSGEYTYTLTNAIGCDSVLRLQLTVIPLPVLSHTLDTVIINGTSATLWASGADYLYWTDGNDSILSSGSSLTVSPGTTTVYYISGQNGDPTAGDNLLVNGDFEAGNTGFSSAYTYVTLQSTYNDYGRYYIIQDGHLVWGPSNLHGYGGSGLFMLVDGATTPNSVIWQQTVDVTPNTYYAFSAQVASTGYSNMYSSYAWLQFSINGTQLGPVFHSPSVLNSWQQYYEVWYSGNNTSATLTLLNQNTTSEGNDFGLDDITFTPLTNCFVTDSILVEVSGYPDNVDSADCTFLPEGTEWGIGQPIISGTIASMCASVPLVGDIDDDGQQEIVMHTNSKVLVFNPDATLKNQFNIASSQQEGQLGLAKVQYGQGDYKTIIVSYSSSNKYFYAYDANGTLLWQSDHPFTSHNGEQSQMPAISFADFNHDGWTEMYAGAEIYDAATGVLLCKANGNKGHAGRTWATNYSTYQSSAADMCDDFDLELVVGNTVYSVDIQSRTDVSLNSVSSIRTLDASEMTMADGTTIPFSDGNTFLVDVNLDGQLDVLVMNVDQLNRVIYLYVWDVVSQSIICSKRIDNARKFGMPQIGDLDNDGFPEICFIVGTYNDHQPGNNETIYALKYNAQSQAEEMDVLWTTSHSDFSGATSLTLFDFNQDGYSELVYRDENHLRIINGSMYNHLTGEAVTSPYDLATYPCGSGTALEYPIVCDVDLDGAAEIIIGSSCSSSTHYGHLYIFKSAGVPWAPARKVWNQYMYNVTNVNEDLTIPQYLFNNATAFTDPEGVVRRPFNNFLQQATNIDQYGRSFYPVPDVVVNGADIQDDEDSVLVTINYCNSGDNTLNAPYTISVFANAYGGDTVCTVTVDESLPVDNCTQSYIQVPLSSLCGFQTLDSLAVAVNCAGTGIAQNGGQQPECDTTNNTATIAVTLPTDSTHLFETACDSYLWYGDSLVQSGEYPHTLTATTGCDSVVIMHLTVNHSTAQTFPLTILENDLPYSFLDTTFYAAGTYVLTLENEFGCDSILTVVLSVFENVSNEVDSLICEGELPFVWNGVEFTQAGTQPAILTAASGADSVVLMTVTLIPTTYGTFDTAVVENALPWQFHNMVCDSAGVYVDTLENVAGCDSVLTLNLTVWPNVTATAYDTVCESELPFTWNDSIFTEAGTKTTTILAHTGADSTVTMILTVIPTTYGTFDTTVVENALPLHYHNLVCDSAGIYTDTLENVAGCDSILTLNLSFWPNVASELDSSVCIDAFPVIWNDSIFTEAGTKTTTILAYTGADSTITMTVTVIPTTYGTFDTTVVENALPWHLHNLVCDSAGVYTDTITNAAGCDSVLTVNLMVWPNVTSELDSAVCEGDFPFTWNDSVFLGADVKTTTIPAHSGADSTITMTVTAISTTYGTFDTAVVENALPWQFHNLVCDSAGVYTDTLVNAAGCDSVLTLNLTVWPNVTATDYDTVCEGDLPFTWNDSIFTEAGTKTTTILAHTGADSTVTMILTVIPTTYSTLDTAVVENALPVHYNDSTYTAEGTYIQNLTNAAGCDSILTVNLTVWPNVTAEQDSSVCETEFPFTWNDSVFTEAGVKTTIILAHTGADSTITMTVTMLSTTYGTIDTAVVENALPLHIHNLTCDSAGVYADTIANEAGCDSILTVLVTVYENVTGEDDSTVCADALPLVWNGVTFTGAGTQTAALLAHTGADSVVTMTLHVNSLSYTTIDTATIQNNLPFHYVNGLIDTTFGVGSPMLTTSQFVFPNSNGCDSVVTLILTVYQNVTTSVDTTVCASSLPYTWHGHTFTAAGSHPVTLLTSHGADSVVTYHLTVDNLSATVGNVTHVTCYGASTGAATVTATGGQTPLTCQWTNAAGTTVSTSSAISNRPAGTYTFTVTDHLGCTATVTVTINTLNGELVPGTIAASQEVCDGEDIAPFTGSAASGGDNGHYQWQISTNGTDWANAPGTSAAQGYTYPNTASNAFTLRRAWVSQSCGTVYSNEVTVSVWPNSSDTITASVCQGEVYQDNGFNVTADETAEAGEYTYEQHHATGHCDSAVILLLTVNPVAAELVEASVCEGEGYNENGFSVLPQETIGESELTRTLNLQSGQGCDSTVTLHLSVIDTSLRLVMLTEDFCEHQEASLSAVSPMPDYVWSTGETATTIVVTSPGLYSVTASEGGCSATASIRVEACHYELVLPNAITPSRGDGLNDCFFIPESFTGNINFFKIYIYNRWGELVFHSTDKNFRWSGEYRGQTQIQTVYNYVIEYTDMVGRPHKIVGSVTVL